MKTKIKSLTKKQEREREEIQKEKEKEIESWYEQSVEEEKKYYQNLFDELIN